jgi:hypothetical protein
MLLICFGPRPVCTAATPPSAPTRHENQTQWKNIPEDTNPWRREPFKSPDTAKNVPALSSVQKSTAGTPDLLLQGIMNKNKHFYAIINGRTVKPGDSIEGWSVAEISRYRVTVRREKEKRIYDIYQGRIDRGTR